MEGYWAAWAAALGAMLLLVTLATLPPFLGPEGRMLVMNAFAPFCHQLPAYSPHINGVQLAVGHRVYGILWGLVLGVLIFPGLLRWDGFWDRYARYVLIAAALPMTLDWTADALELWTKTSASRLTTGILFGLAAGYYLARAVAKLSRGGDPEQPAS